MRSLGRVLIQICMWRRHAALPADYSRKCLRVQNVCRMCLPRDIPLGKRAVIIAEKTYRPLDNVVGQGTALTPFRCLPS
jgi:hypothetical protein